MAFFAGDVIDERYLVDSTCSESGGMGELFFVRDNEALGSEVLVLKLCRELDEEYINRFRREVRLLKDFKGNPMCQPATRHYRSGIT